MKYEIKRITIQYTLCSGIPFKFVNYKDSAETFCIIIPELFCVCFVELLNSKI